MIGGQRSWAVFRGAHSCVSMMTIQISRLGQDEEAWLGLKCLWKMRAQSTYAVLRLLEKVRIAGQGLDAAVCYGSADSSLVKVNHRPNTVDIRSIRLLWTFPKHPSKRVSCRKMRKLS